MTSSKYKLNKTGDSGHPCLTPWVMSLESSDIHGVIIWDIITFFPQIQLLLSILLQTSKWCCYPPTINNFTKLSCFIKYRGRLKLLYSVGLYQHKAHIETECVPFTGPVWPRGWVEVKLSSSMTAALEGGEWSAARPGRTLPPGKTRYPFYRRLGGPNG